LDLIFKIISNLEMLFSILLAEWTRDDLK